MRGKGLNASGQLFCVELNSFSFHESPGDLVTDWTNLVLPNGSSPKDVGMEVMSAAGDATSRTDDGAGA
jgi:hypothetical protein